MRADSLRMVILLGIVAAITLYLTQNYNSDVGTTYLLLLSICLLTYYFAPLTSMSTKVLILAFIMLWVHINYDRTIGLYGLLTSLAVFYLLEK